MQFRLCWALIFVVLIVLSGCDKQTRKTTEPTKKNASQASDETKQEASTSSSESQGDEQETELQFAVKGVTLSWQESGKPRLSAEAKELTGNTVQGTALMKNVEALLYDKGKLVAKLSAPSVKADEKSRIITATGGVVITSQVKGSTISSIEAEWIKWYSREDKLVGNGGIKAKGSLASIEAAAFTADTRLETVKIFSDPSEAKAIVGRP